ncbi:AI-2E family transporter [Dissulfuribacter thermophilus]|nr:AI-2E family transporter [Dissulfuribacter thermophilus]
MDNDIHYIASGKIIQFLAVGLGFLIFFCGALLFLPFFEPICWAIILALFFYPIHKRLVRFFRGSRALSALVMCVLNTAFIIIPVFILLGSLTSEVLRVYTGIQHSIQSGHFTIIPDKEHYPRLNNYVSKALKALETHEESLHQTIVELSKRTGEYFIRQGTAVAKNVANIIFKAALMLVTLYYLFRDGEEFLKVFKSLLPLKPQNVDHLTSVTADVLYATLYGNLLTSAIQGGLGVFILWVLGFSAPILWGIVMGVATFIPMIGTALVWLPATLYLFLTGAYLKGAILLSFSILVISQIDYFLRPYFISGKTELHSLFLFFSILGGLNLFGFLGLILGPIIIALCMSVMEFYRQELLGKYEKTLYMP